MSITATIIVALLVVIVAPIWIVAHYTTRWRTARMLSKEQERVLRDLWELAQGMERRVESLETILDAEAPGWRGRTQGRPESKADPKVDPWGMEASP